MQSFQVCVQIIKLSGHIKAQAFLFFKPGLIGSGLGLMIFHKMTPRTHLNVTKSLLFTRADKGWKWGQLQANPASGKSGI